MPSRTVRLALAGGGSGGHLFPGIALAHTLLGDAGRPILYGSGKAAESSWVGETAERVALGSPLLPGRKGEVPAFLVRLAQAVGASLREFRARRPDLVVGLGGYASVGPGIAALLSGRPLLLLEQNAVPGKANRLLARLGGRMAAAWPESLVGLPLRARSRSRVVGNPVRSELLRGRRDPGGFGLPSDRPVLLVTGGSQGADGLNARVTACAGVLAANRIGVIHLTGAGGESSSRRAWAEAGADAFVAGFCDRMGDAYATADLVVARGGGTTLAELTLLGKPSVLVPYPHHADRHQELNARVLVAAGAAALVAEADLTPERFAHEVLERLGNPEVLATMGAAAAAASVPDAAERAAGFAREMISRSRS